MRRTFWRPSRVWVALATLAVVAIALLPSSWSPAVAQTGGGDPPPTSTSTSTSTSTATSTTTSTATSTTIPATGGSVTVPNAGLTINFGNGALGANTRVDFTPLVPPPTTNTVTPQQAQQTNNNAVLSLTTQNIPPPPGVSTTGTGGALIQSLFTLNATNTTNNSGVTTFNAPVTLAIVVPAGTLSLAGGNLANVQVFRFNETTRAWVQVACGVGAGGLSCSTSGFSVWALVIATPAAPQTTPATGTGAGGATPVAPRPAATGTGLAPESTSILPMLGAILALGGLLGVGAFAVQRRRA